MHFASLISWTAPSNGTYYLAATDSSRTSAPDAYVVNAEVVGDDHSREISGATMVDVPSVTAGRIDSLTDIDFFAFNTTVGTVYQIRAEQSEQSFSLPSFQVMNRGGEPVASGEYWTAPTSDTYFIQVHSRSFQRIGEYTLTLDTIEYADDHANLPGDATTVSVPSITMGEVEHAADVDFFSFSATKGVEYTLYLRHLNESPPWNSVKPVLFDTDGSSVIQRVNMNSSVVTWTADGDGTYYLSVDSSGPLEAYSLHVESSADDAGGDHENAMRIAVPSVTSGVFRVGTDVDMYAFEATAGMAYSFTALKDLPWYLLPDLRLFDTDGVTLIDGVTRNTELGWVAPRVWNLLREAEQYFHRAANSA